MPSIDPSYHLAQLKLEFQSLSDSFDLALKNDVVLMELKKIFHEMKKLHAVIEGLAVEPVTPFNNKDRHDVFI